MNELNLSFLLQIRVKKNYDSFLNGNTCGNKKLWKKSSGDGTIFAWFGDDLAGFIVSKK